MTLSCITSFSYCPLFERQLCLLFPIARLNCPFNPTYHSVPLFASIIIIRLIIIILLIPFCSFGSMMSRTFLPITKLNLVCMNGSMTVSPAATAQVLALKKRLPLYHLKCLPVGWANYLCSVLKRHRVHSIKL